MLLAGLINSSILLSFQTVLISYYYVFFLGLFSHLQFVKRPIRNFQPSKNILLSQVERVNHNYPENSIGLPLSFRSTLHNSLHLSPCVLFIQAAQLIIATLGMLLSLNKTNYLYCISRCSSPSL